MNGLYAKLEARVGRLAIDVELETRGGTLAIVGPNGAGKSSVLALLLGALPVARGRVSIGEHVLLDTEAGIDVPLERRRLGYVPQDYALFAHMSVREHLGFALTSALPRLARDARDARVEAMLKELELGAFANRRPHALSGGERQRVALARALCIEPRALLLDEPLAALDVHARDEVRHALATRLTQLALPTLLVTHDAQDARLLAQRIAVLEAGRFVQVGTWDELCAHPATPFVSRLVG